MDDQQFSEGPCEPLPALELVVAPSPMQVVVLHVSPDSDMIAAITEFVQRENGCISVLSTSGWVKNASAPLRVPSPHASAPAELCQQSVGRHKLLSLSGTVLMPPMVATPPVLSALLASESETGTNYAGEVRGLTANDELVVVALAAPMDCCRVHQLPMARVHVDTSWLRSRFGPFPSTPTGGSSGAGSGGQQAQTLGIRGPIRR